MSDPFIVVEIIGRLKAYNKKSFESKNIGLEFYSLGARNDLFQLEAIARIYRSEFGKEKAQTLLDQIKNAEDALGAFDFNYALDKQMNAVEGLNHDLKTYFKNKSAAANKVLTTFLVDKKWVANSNDIYDELENSFLSMQLSKSKEWTEVIGELIIKELNKIHKRITEGEFRPLQLELGVHEIRRKLRWISIYSQAANGLVQLIENSNKNTSLTKYLKPEIVSSPFNKLPKKPAGKSCVEIQKDHFYSLSWMITELGKLKDVGLLKEYVDYAFNDIKLNDHKEIEKTYKLLGLKKDSIEVVLRSSDIIIDKFMEDDKVCELIVDDVERSLKNIKS
jgi:hypothetical protein